MVPIMFMVVYITAWSANEAQRITHALVSNNLEACVNMHPYQFSDV